jgi:hypothetical protein
VSTQHRRALVRAYKERKTEAGIYALRCEATGEAWVGQSRNIDAQANGAFFALRRGGHPNRDVQAAWNAHGEDAFRFEVLERIDTDELTALGAADRLKAGAAHWMAELGARRAVG